MPILRALGVCLFLLFAVGLFMAGDRADRDRCIDKGGRPSNVGVPLFWNCNRG